MIKFEVMMKKDVPEHRTYYESRITKLHNKIDKKIKEFLDNE
jgi:hypothetical protein